MVPEFFVMDCSIVLSWYFADESNKYADLVASSLEKSSALVPSLWTLEVANTLVIGERRKRSTHAQASVFLASLSKLPIIIDEQTTAQAWSSTVELARKCTLSVYDATYLEVALRRNVPISTLDNGLKAAARSLGIAFYKP